MKTKSNVVLLASLACFSTARCQHQTNLKAPPAYNEAEVIPAQPLDPANPFPSVVWVLHYDMRQFDATWSWLDAAVPAGPPRDMARGTAAMLGVAELGRGELADIGIADLTAATAAFPHDARLPLWLAYLQFLQLKVSGHPATWRMRRATRPVPWDSLTSFKSMLARLATSPTRQSTSF